MPTNDYSKNIVYLSKEQYQELITNETLTVNGQTITYNDNDIYVTPQAEPITDIKINGTSIGSNGVANIPLGTSTTPGVVMGVGNGIQITNGYVQVSPAVSSMIQLGSSNAGPVCVSRQHEAVFFGLSKVAGVDLASVTCTLGIYPDTSKAAIQNMLGITNLIASEEAATATAAHAANSLFMMNGKLHRATAAIAIGDAVEVGTNCEVVKADEVFVKNTDYATKNDFGIVKIGNGITISNGVIAMTTAAIDTVKNGSSGIHALTPNRQHEVVYYGLSKLAGVDLANETVTVGAYPNASKVAICKMIDALGISNISTGLSVTQDADTEDWILTANVQDVQINGTSIVNNGTANIPLASNDTFGVVKTGGYGIRINNDGVLFINPASIQSEVKPGAANYLPIVPGNQHASTFYGLAKAAGADMASSDNAIGTYTETAKVAIRNMLGATSSNVIAVQDEQPTDTDTKVWLPETEAQGIQVPTMEDMANYVQKTDIASSTNYGIIKATNYYGVDMITTGSDAGFMRVYKAPSDQIKTGVNNYRPIVPSTQHEGTFYGLAKAAGDTTQSISTNAVGTYTSEAKTAIQNMLDVPSKVQVTNLISISNTTPSDTNTKLWINTDDSTIVQVPTVSEMNIALAGKVGDVQVNGTSIVSNGVANIPIAVVTNSSGNGQYGLVKINSSNGITIANDGCLSLNRATNSDAKSASNAYKVCVPYWEDYYTFYGLAKAAGDITQSASSNAIGTYTTEAKAAIHTMLGIDPASIAAQVDIPLVETVSGITPTITGQPNVRYVCGEVSTITITPPASGSVDVIFESGSTATTMTVPSTVKWPAWFDAEALEANTIYEVLITDGIYGSVMTWAT